MTYNKISLLVSCIVVLMLNIVPVSADMFNETVGPVLDESTDFGKMLLLSIVAICVIVCALAMVIGGLAHKRAWVSKGAEGFGLILGVAIIVYSVTSLFNYIVGKWW